MIMQLESLPEPEGASGEQVNEEEDDAAGGKKSRRKRKKRKKAAEKWEVGDDANLAQPRMKDSSKWIEQYDAAYPNRILGASAKTIAIKNQILMWQRDAPDDKIIGKHGPIAYPTIHNLSVPTNPPQQSFSTGPNWPASSAACSTKKASRSSTTSGT
jgi:hypothetical protein